MDRIPVPFAALVNIIGTIDVKSPDVAAFNLSVVLRTFSFSIAEIFPSSESRTNLLGSGGRMEGILPLALTAESILERVCLRLVLEAKSSFVITTAKGLSNFRQSSRCTFARSMPSPACNRVSTVWLIHRLQCGPIELCNWRHTVPSISCADEVPPVALGAFSPSSAATQSTVQCGAQPTRPRTVVLRYLGWPAPSETNTKRPVSADACMSVHEETFPEA